MDSSMYKCICKPWFLCLAFASVLTMASCADDYEVIKTNGRCSVSSSVNTVVSYSVVRYTVRNKVVSSDLGGEVYLRGNTSATVSNLRFYVNDSLVMTASRLPYDGDFYLHDVNLSNTDRTPFVFKTAYVINGEEKCDSIKEMFK